jgi:hypothetical protein
MRRSSDDSNKQSVDLPDTAMAKGRVKRPLWADHQVEAALQRTIARLQREPASFRQMIHEGILTEQEYEAVRNRMLRYKMITKTQKTFPAHQNPERGDGPRQGAGGRPSAIWKLARGVGPDGRGTLPEAAAKAHKSQDEAVPAQP